MSEDEQGQHHLNAQRLPVPDLRMATPEPTTTVALTAMQYCPDSLLLASDSDGWLNLWHLQQQRHCVRWRIRNDGSYVTRLARQGDQLMTTTDGGLCQLWDIELDTSSLELKAAVAISNAVHSLSSDAVLGMAVVATVAGQAHMINWEDASSMPVLTSSSAEITASGLSYDGEFLLTGCAAGSVRVWHATTLEQTLQFQVQAPASLLCTCVSFSSSDRRVAAGFADGVLRLFDLDNMELEAKMTPFDAAYTACCFSRDGRVVISSSNQGHLIISSATTGRTLRSLKDHAKTSITQLKTALNNNDLHAGVELWLACSQERRISVWTSDWSRDFNELIDWLTFPAPVFEPTKQLPEMPPTLAVFAPSNPDWIITTCYSATPGVWIYSLQQRNHVRSIGLPRYAISLDVSDAFHYVAVGSLDRVLTLVDLEAETFQDYAGQFEWRVAGVHFVSSRSRSLITVSGHSLSRWLLPS
eukprot:TRINITY_DN5150_c0_g2_i1.p1 TRINITY_DN5150_c0_g2~~TRINITY_DN5150_c0_g2_i1.p1  ORF type:complete len:503 (+),score=92.38 TRINITY_DN5150_c0_g2_i1:97-1509(+)